MDGNPERNNPGRVFGVYGGNGPALYHDAMPLGSVKFGQNPKYLWQW
jgi:hypothetical protein